MGINFRHCVMMGVHVEYDVYEEAILNMYRDDFPHATDDGSLLDLCNDKHYDSANSLNDDWKVGQEILSYGESSCNIGVLLACTKDGRNDPAWFNDVEFDDSELMMLDAKAQRFLNRLQISKLPKLLIFTEYS